MSSTDSSPLLKKLSPLLSWIPGKTVLRLLQQDRLLATVTCLLAAVTLAPLFATSFLPFVDLPGNVANASLLLPTLFKQGITPEHYSILWRPIPYWTAYLFIAVCNAIAGPLFAAKAITGLLVTLLPLCTMRFLVALRRNPRIGIWAFALVWDRNLYWGWVTFLLGMCIAMVALARLIEAKNARQAARVIPWTMLVALTHIEAVAFVLTAGGLLSLGRRPVIDSIARYAIGLSGTILLIAPWLINTFIPIGPPKASPPLELGYPTVAEKISLLFPNSIDNVFKAPGNYATAFAFGVFLFVAPMLAASEPLPGKDEHRWESAAMLAASVLLYFGLPNTVGGPIVHWSTYPRFSTYMLLSMLFLPRPKLDGKGLWVLLPGVIAVLVVNGATFQQFQVFGKNSAPFLQIMEATQPDKRLLALPFDDQDPAVKDAPYEQFHCYLTAAKRLYDAKIFDHPTNPLQFKNSGRLPQVQWHGAHHFTMEQHGKHYDYILVQGLRNDPVPRQAEAAKIPVKLVKESARWRLYSVERPR